MFIRILKKDLKRKKTMNVILLLFVIMSAMFISSSLNNVFTITTALDNYMTKAGVSDYLFFVIDNVEENNKIEKYLNENKYVDSWFKDKSIVITQDNLKSESKEKFMGGTLSLSKLGIKQQKFFDINNQEIKKVNKGEIYLSNKDMKKNNIKVGDIINFVSEDITLDFTVKGLCKDVTFGSSMMGYNRLLISDEDYKYISENTDFMNWNIISIDTNNVKAFGSDYNKQDFNIIMGCDKGLLKTSYVMDMVIATLLIIVSVCLILIALVILRFTIFFTLNEEFREIGIMKAIGLKTRKIRGLYIIKYSTMAIIGSAIGFFLSIPFGEILIKQVSKSIIMERVPYAMFISIASSIFISLVVVGFSYLCTRKINKFSPIDAIRNGSVGERFKRKSLIKLSRDKMSSSVFMAINDILSSFRSFIVLIITFTIGIVLTIIIANTSNTLRDGSITDLFGLSKSELFLSNDRFTVDFVSRGDRAYIENTLSKIKGKLKENNIDSDVYMETFFRFKIDFNSESYRSMALIGTGGVTTKEYIYTEGTPPEHENEVAITHVVKEKIGADIGDLVTINTGDGDEKYIVTAIYQSMNNMGEGIRFYEKKDLNFKNVQGGPGIQVRYKDKVSGKEEEDRKDKIRELFPEYDVYDSTEYMSTMLGDIVGQLDGIKSFIIIIVMLINVLVGVLVQKTFMTKERGEIGMMKAIGFKNSAIIKWQTYRMSIVMIISTIIGAVISNPISQVSSAQVFKMMGARHIEFVIKPMEVYLIYPVLIFVVTILAILITATGVRHVSVQETNNIE